MPKYIDLHIHTIASDGSYPPTQIIEMANKNKLSAIAITDHDTIAGLEEGEEAAKKCGLEFVRGCELSTRYNEHSIHIVGLFIPSNLQDFPEFTLALLDFQARRNRRNQLMVDKLNSYGITISITELTEIAGGQIIARPHFARLLVSKKIVSSEQEAFEKFLKKDKIAYVPRESITANQAVSLFAKIGAVPVLAHPMLSPMEKSTLEAMIIDLKNDGLKAIEVYHSSHSKYDEKIILELVKKHDLLISGGSDFHGMLKPTVKLGTGKGGLRIPYECYEKLKNCAR